MACQSAATEQQHPVLRQVRKSRRPLSVIAATKSSRCCRPDCPRPRAASDRHEHLDRLGTGRFRNPLRRRRQSLVDPRTPNASSTRTARTIQSSPAGSRCSKSGSRPGRSLAFLAGRRKGTFLSEAMIAQSVCDVRSNWRLASRFRTDFGGRQVDCEVDAWLEQNTMDRALIALSNEPELL